MKNSFTYNKKMMIAVNAPPLHSALISLPPSHLLEKREKPCAWIYPSFYKKSVYRWTIWASIILSPSVRKNLWCMAVLGVRIMGSDLYRDKKFIFFWVWATYGFTGNFDILVCSYLRFIDNFGIFTVAAPRRPARGL